MCLFERVEHNPILALSGGQQAVLLAVGLCEDVGVLMSSHLSRVQITKRELD